MISRRAFVAAVAGAGAALALVPSGAFADAVSTFVDKGYAIRGYDPVAYFTTAKPTPGSDQFVFEHDGVKYRFASQEHLDAFKADPAKYLPQYGGFCALATAYGQKVPVDPNAWKLVDGKLYLNANKQAQTIWQRDVPGNIKRADTNWPRIKDIPADKL